MPPLPNFIQVSRRKRPAWRTAGLLVWMLLLYRPGHFITNKIYTFSWLDVTRGLFHYYLRITKKRMFLGAFIQRQESAERSQDGICWSGDEKNMTSWSYQIKLYLFSISVHWPKHSLVSISLNQIWPGREDMERPLKLEDQVEVWWLLWLLG